MTLEGGGEGVQRRSKRGETATLEEGRGGVGQRRLKGEEGGANTLEGGATMVEEGRGSVA